MIYETRQRFITQRNTFQISSRFIPLACPVPENHIQRLARLARLPRAMLVALPSLHRRSLPLSLLFFSRCVRAAQEGSKSAGEGPPDLRGRVPDRLPPPPPSRCSSSTPDALPQIHLRNHRCTRARAHTHAQQDKERTWHSDTHHTREFKDLCLSCGSSVWDPPNWQVGEGGNPIHRITKPHSVVDGVCRAPSNRKQRGLP